MSAPLGRAVADTSIFIAREAGRELGPLPDEIAVSAITAGELELGVLRAANAAIRGIRLSTLAEVRGTYPLLEIDALTASCYARIADGELAAGRRVKQHDTWIAATAMRHGVAVLTQDDDFASFDQVEVIRV
ncbi:MAG TPA: PIN domain-containing protein [Thermoleophilaceae bacterium]|nr:PIN domain-containing protein [Thermoleophilaceae bacterium]